MKLAELVAASESATLEFKKSTAEKDRACRTLCAFANGQGGRVLFGVTPAGKIVGQSITDRTLEELAQELQNFEPPITIHVQRLPAPGALEVLELIVERNPRGPVSYRGVPYERVINTTRVMPRTTYQRLLLESMHASARWETEAAEDWDPAQLDQEEILNTLNEAIRRGRFEEPDARDILSILRGFGLLTQNGKLSRAAVALFCRDDQPLNAYPQFKLRLARFKGTNRDEFLDNRQYTGNAFALKRRAERFLMDWLPIASKIVPGKMERIDTPALPTEAVREALANAFVHRDYASAAGSVGVALYDDRLEIISPGELHFGQTPETLYQPHESQPWNPWIAGVFYRRGVIETWGRGMLKIATQMQAAGLPAPTISETIGFVVMTFDLPQRHAQGEDANQDTPGKTPVETPVEIKLPGERRGNAGETPGKILMALSQNPYFSIPDLVKLTGLNTRTIERNLTKLQAENRLVRIGPAKGGSWKVLD